MNHIEVFGVNWSREILRQEEHNILTAIAVIKYINANGDYCFITNDLLNMLPYPENFKWKIDNAKILSSIEKACRNDTPLFICFNNEQKKAITGTLNNSFIKNASVVSAEEIFK